MIWQERLQRLIEATSALPTARPDVDNRAEYLLLAKALSTILLGLTDRGVSRLVMNGDNYTFRFLILINRQDSSCHIQIIFGLSPNQKVCFDLNLSHPQHLNQLDLDQLYRFQPSDLRAILDLVRSSTIVQSRP